jgi:hypothetical protein
MNALNLVQPTLRTTVVAFVACMSALDLCGCAGITVSGAAPASPEDTKAEGFRYYQAKPFLFVHADGKGSLSSELIWLPDPSKIMSIHPYAVLASNSTTLKFTNGTLDEASATVDETVVPSAILSALASANVVKFIDTTASPLPNTGDVPAPYLFRILYDTTNGTVIFKGNAATYRIKATVVKSGAK